MGNSPSIIPRYSEKPREIVARDRRLELWGSIFIKKTNIVLDQGNVISCELSLHLSNGLDGKRKTIGRSPGKLLPEAEDLGQQFFMSFFSYQWTTDWLLPRKPWNKFFVHVLFPRQWRQMRIYIKHTYGNKCVLNRSCIPESL